MNKKIFILGGGTAGWLTALFINKTFPEYQVSLLESEEIGVLGAGESTLMPFFNLLKDLDINENEFIKETNSVFKLGSYYGNWSGDESFHVNATLPGHGMVSPETYGGNMADYFTFCFANNIDIKTRGLTKYLLHNKSPYALINNKVEQIGAYTYQINAQLTARYFRKLAQSRGVIRYEGKATKINGDTIITSIEDDHNRIHKFDFVFDCSGFARLIIGKHHQTPWIDYTQHLPVDSAIPFFLPIEKEIPSYSSAIAMKHGWMFKLPTRERYGSGYVFDSNRVSSEEAKEEVVKRLGHDIDIIKNIKFRAGAYERAWIGNSIAFCLAGGFLEPMTATNIGGMIFQFEKIKQSGLFNTDVNDFNQYTKDMNTSFLNLVFMHYMTHRQDTDFWKYLQNKNETYPEQFRLALEKHIVRGRFDIKGLSDVISQPADKIITLFQGNDLYKKQAIEYCAKNRLNERYKMIDAQILKNTDTLILAGIDHRDYLENYI
jgi:tryptophan halogenase